MTADAARLVSLFERGERLSAAGKTLMAARAVECHQWARDGAQSPREWLSQVSGVPLGSAQRTLDTAEQLVAQPELAGAFKAGDLSPAQAAEISSAVAENPAAAPRLLRTSTGCESARCRRSSPRSSRRSGSRFRWEAKGRAARGERLLCRLGGGTPLHQL